MRLLSSTTLKFVQIEGDNLPGYAILSHTWGNDEVLYADMINGTASSKAGYVKIEGCAKVALFQGLSYFWVDTVALTRLQVQS